ncbi:MAG: hypothetical protein LBJ32_03425 [Oscillospiraceae bacterium]|jgi:bacteriocin-like protein|nr:hypothetical protein [Oscillospiraceae bacterium]
MSKSLQDLLNNKKFVTKLLKQNTEEDVRKLFFSEGIKITDENLKNLKNLCVEMIDQVKNMNDNELKNVAGGIDLNDLKDMSKNPVLMTTIAIAGIGLTKGLSNIKKEDSLVKKVLMPIASTFTGAIMGMGLGNLGVYYNEKLRNWAKNEIEELKAKI